MEMHQLRYFVRVAELKNFTRAAESCGVAQPSLSQQISKLERELGYPLFERSGRRISLTDSGEILYEHATRILAHAEEAEVQIRDAAATGKGRVTIGAIPTVAPFLLPRILDAFTSRFPEASVEVHELVTTDLIRKCQGGEIDLILLAVPFDDTGLRFQPLVEEELLVVLSRKHPLAKNQRISVAQLQTQQFVLLTEAHCLSDNILSFCNQKSFLPTINCRGSQLQTIQEMVAVGKGISLIPEMAARKDKSSARVYRTLAGKRPKRKIVMAWNRNRFQSRLAKQLMETVREKSQS